MPILVVCPGCGASLNAPDSGAGKRVRCPKPNCGTLIPVPGIVDAEPVEAEEVPEPQSRRSRAPVEDDEDDRPRSKRRRADEEDDDRPQRKRRADDEDERPRSRRRAAEEDDRPSRRRQKSGGTGKIIAIVLGSLLLLAGLGYGVYALVSRSGPKTPPPPGWNEYTFKEANFKAHFPKQPTTLGGGGLGGGKGGGGFGGFGDNLGIDSHFVCTCGDMFSDPVSVQVDVMLFKSRLPSAVRDQYANMADTFNRPDIKQFGAEMAIGAKSVRWLGESGTELVLPTGVMRMVAVDRGIYQATISGRGGRRATPEEEKAFFDNFVLLK